LRAGPENNLFRINGPGGFLLAAGGPGCRSVGPCHLCQERHTLVCDIETGVKFTQHWNSAGHNCRNKLRPCANVLSKGVLEPCRQVRRNSRRAGGGQ